ncbi:MAG: aminotransferase [Clostridiales bacterium 38-18]|nr:MAG: aminotransferase [Clostridiales bacterium 38-18]
MNSKSNLDFNEVINRHNTNSVKYDAAAKMGKPSNLIPLWVADMDFKAPKEVIDAMKERSEHGIFGYTDAISESYFNAVQNWMIKHHQWTPQKEWLVMTPSIVNAICVAIRTLTEVGDSIIVQQPVYHPFAESILTNQRNLVVNPLVYTDGTYQIDFEDFERKIVENQVKMFILCNPHNPVGRVWSKEDLTKLGDLCVKHDVIVVADEIHADFVYEDFGNKHVVFSDLKPEYLNRTITCTAPSKSFNLAGLQQSNIFIANEVIRENFKKELVRMGLGNPNVMGFVACQAAYEHGESWLKALKAYLVENIRFIEGFLEEKLPEVKLIRPQGTYLLWLDFSALGLTPAELNSFIAEKAGLWLNSGTMFGVGGEGFQRMNITYPKSTLEKALNQLYNAVRMRVANT